MLTADEVKKIAQLSYLLVQEHEIKEYGSQLTAIIDYINQLNEIDISGVEPTSHVHGSTNVLREDVQHPSLAVDELIKISPDRSGRFIRVPIVIEEA